MSGTQNSLKQSKDICEKSIFGKHVFWYAIWDFVCQYRQENIMREMASITTNKTSSSN